MPASARRQNLRRQALWQKALSGSGKRLCGKRDRVTAPRFNRDDRRRRKRPYTPRGDRGDARPAARSSDRKFGDKKPYASRDGGGEKRPYKPRGEGFRKDGDRPRGDRPQGDRPYSARPPRDGDRPRGSSRAKIRRRQEIFARRAGSAVRARISAAGIAAAVHGDRGDSKPWQKRDAVRPITSDAIRVRRAMAREILTSRVSTSRVMTSRARIVVATSARVFASREDAQGIVPVLSVRAMIGRNSTVRANGLRAAPTGRSIRAAKGVSPIVRAATMKTTARYSPNARPSAAAAPIASASRTSRSARRGRRAKRNPASASPRWCRAPGWPRAATPRNGSCRAASPSTAA